MVTPQNTVISSAFLASQPSKLNSYDVRTLSYYLEFTKLLAVIHINALMWHCIVTYLNKLHIYRTNMYQSCKVSTRSWWKPLTSSVSGSRGRNPSIDSFSENNEKARIDRHSRSLPCLSSSMWELIEKNPQSQPMSTLVEHHLPK